MGTLVAEVAGICYGQLMDEKDPSNPQPMPPPDDFVVYDDVSPDHSLLHDQEPVPPTPRDDLDANQIKKVTHRRRTAVRSRGYLLVGSAFCAALAVQTIWNSVGRFRSGSNVIGAAYVMAAAILLALGWKAFV